MTSHKGTAIAPCFNEADLKLIDAARGERTRSAFCHTAILQFLLDSMKTTFKRQKPVELKHDCGAKFDVLKSGEDVFLLCPKCHVSAKKTKAEYEQAIENAIQPSATIPVLPDAPATNQAATS